MGAEDFSHADGGGTKGFEVVFTWKLEVLAILKLGRGGERKKNPLFKEGGGQKVLSCLDGGGGGGGAKKSFGPAVFPFCSPPSP